MSWSSRGGLLLVLGLVLLLCPAPTLAFGAGNIPGISTVEGHNWRHGDIEDMLKTVAFLKGGKWSSMMIKRVYFGNWLRDYSQAIDVGSVKGVSAPTIRILVWVLSFLSFGYATAEFEVTEERLGVYRPEEHIDNPKDYADNVDARTFDPRLRGPVQPAELEVDPSTGMKNYIANDRGGWSTSTGYVKHSLSRSIHFGRTYTNGSGSSRGKEADLCEALRCLGQGLHCLEDFGAHTNYVELVLIELGYREVFPHVGSASEINLNGRRVYPLTTGTFGAVDFLHSMLGEATDHLSQSEIDELDIALKNAESTTAGTGTRGLFGSSSGGGDDFMNLLSQIPGQGAGLASQARDLQAQSQAQEYENQTTRDPVNTSFQGPPGSVGGPPGPGVPGMKPDFDPVKTAARIYPILEFRDKIVKAISATIARIPGLEKLVETISEKITVFIMSLLAPFVRPIIEAVSKSLKDGSSTVVKASADQQYIPWNDPHCTDPTHSMLAKDHFSNYLNPVGGRVAATILQYAVPRVLYAWENPGVPVDEVVNDILRVFHHPATRKESTEIQRNMFNTVKKWADENPERNSLNQILGSASVKAGRNHKGENVHGAGGHSHGGGDNSHSAFGGYGQTANAVWSKIQARDLGAMRDVESSSRGDAFGGAPESPAFGYSSGHGGGAAQFGSGEQYSNTSRPTSGYGYQGAAPAPNYGYDSAPPPTRYQSHDAGRYQEPQGQYQGGGGGYAPQNTGFTPQQPGPGYGTPPPQNTGFAPQQQGPGYGSPPPQHFGHPPPPFGGPGEVGGYPPQSQRWNQGPAQPPPQQGGWQQGPPQDQYGQGQYGQGQYGQDQYGQQQQGWGQQQQQQPPPNQYPGQGYPGQGYPGQGQGRY